jgi:hypothetical protein
MSGGLMRLVALGIQDIYLTNNGSINNSRTSSSNQLINNINPTVKRKIINKYITDKDKLYCPITLRKIKKNQKYMQCTVCKNNMLAMELIQWLDKHYNCPLCRTMWDSNQNIYKNSKNHD